jgi:hypothetical protein
VLRIRDIISRKRLTALGYGDPARDPAVPHIIVQPDLGVIYTTSKKKIEEHGGLTRDDRNVACFVSGKGLGFKEFKGRVSTAQVAPTILKVLGLDAKALRGVVSEGTDVLPGFH